MYNKDIKKYSVVKDALATRRFWSMAQLRLATTLDPFGFISYICLMKSPYKAFNAGRENLNCVRLALISLTF